VRIASFLTIAVNQDYVMTFAEVQVYRGDIPPQDRQPRPAKRKLRLLGALSATFDRRTDNVVQIVNDQGKCASRWPFAVIAARAYTGDQIKHL
jgi:C1A family cysteine protease